MKFYYIGSFLLAPILALGQTIEITADQPSAVYKCDAPATFSLQVFDAEKQPLKSGTLNVTITSGAAQDGITTTFDLKDQNPVTCSGTLHEPGFLKCVATIKLDKSYRGIFGVAFEPEKIQVSSERPSDFDAFWNAALQKLETQVPLDPIVERLEKSSNAKRECFAVSFATFDNQRVYGFLSVPSGDGPFAVEVNVPGAGPGVFVPSTGLADKGIIQLVMNVHGYAPGATDEEQKLKYAEQDKLLAAQYGAPRYCQSGAAKRETYFYYRSILGINRAVHWLAAQPKVDKARFRYCGTSQGGGFGLILCGLNPNFVQGSIHVAALTDLLGFQKNRPSGWPRLIESIKEEDKEAASNVAPYFDAAHFAPRITCPVRMSVGFIDEVCPPSAVYAAYNALKVKDKAITHGIGMTHTVFPKVYEELDHQWLRGNQALP